MKKKSKIKLEDLKIQSFSTTQGLSREATLKIVGGTMEPHGNCTTYTNGCYCESANGCTNGGCTNGYLGCTTGAGGTETTCPTWTGPCGTWGSNCCTNTCATASAAGSGCSCVYC